MSERIKNGRYKEFKSGQKAICWYKNGEYHREENLPAIEYLDGTKEWFIDGQRHRENGPAFEHAIGLKFWYLYNVEYTEENFYHYLEKKRLNETLHQKLDIKNLKPKAKL